MRHIYKGKIASISGGSARVIPSDDTTRPTAYITIPQHLAGYLEKGTEVVYAEFDDATGLLLGRTDGIGGQGGTAEDLEKKYVTIEVFEQHKTEAETTLGNIDILLGTI